VAEVFAWWYALPNFNADDYVQGRIRFNAAYLRGWYQNDSTYRASAGDTLFLPDTQTTFTYQKIGDIGNTMATIAGSSPKFFVFPIPPRIEDRSCIPRWATPEPRS